MVSTYKIIAYEKLSDANLTPLTYGPWVGETSPSNTSQGGPFVRLNQKRQWKDDSSTGRAKPFVCIY